MAALRQAVATLSESCIQRPFDTVLTKFTLKTCEIGTVYQFPMTRVQVYPWVVGLDGINWNNFTSSVSYRIVFGKKSEQ
jgi:hypothetical protein